MNKMILKKIALYVLLLMLSAGCKVGYTFKGGIIPGKTFSMNNFPNNSNTVNPNLSFMVFDAMRQKVLSESSLRFVENNGDAHFEGTIVTYNIDPVQATGDVISNLSKLTIGITIEYSNTANPEINYSKTFSDFDNFDNSEDFSAIEDELVEKILKKLVDQIYNESMEDW